MKIQDLMAGLEPGMPQIVGNMAVIPLVSAQTELSGISGAENIGFAGDNDYNTLHLTTVEDALTVVPAGFTYITEESAQDRSIPSVNVIEKATELQAYCVQSSQHGFMRSGNDSKREMHLLPLAIRHAAFNSYRVDKKYSGLWEVLRIYNSSLNVSGNFLTSLFNKYQAELEQFVAQFEPIHGQRGSIVLINGQVKGIDIFPSFKSFLSIWKVLIRDSYGMQAIQERNNSRELTIFPLESVTSPAELLQAVENQISAEKSWAYNITRACVEQESKVIQDQQYNSKQVGIVHTKDIRSEELEGQVVHDSSDRLIYMSLFRHASAKAKVKAFTL